MEKRLMGKSIAAMPIIDCMTPFLITLDRYASLAEAYEKMTVNQIRRIPVVERDKLVGIITLGDILRFKPAEVGRYLSFNELSGKLDSIVVDLVMARDPIVVNQSDELGYAAELMLENKIGGLPVLDASRRLVGLITESDVFRILVHQWREEGRLKH
jgi:acetoin utilization protein AcuB